MAINFIQNGKVTPMSEALAALGKFKKDLGESVAHLGDEIAEVERIPTGILPLDLSMGGGFPRNRISIVYGGESSGKTALSYLAMAEVQRQGQKAVFVDLERTYDPAWASKFGLNIHDLIVLDPHYAEQAVDMVETMLYANDVGIVVVDSVAAMTTDNEIASSAEKMNVGGNSYIVGKMVRKATRALGRENAPSLFLINQIRHKIGVMFGDPECLHADTLINFVDGRSLPIRQVVEQKLQGKVWGFDEHTNEFRPCNIIGWHHNHKGPANDGDFLSITTRGVDTNNGVLSATTSYTHKFLTDSGWKEARDLTLSDNVVTRYTSVLSETAVNFLRGAFCGDTTIHMADNALCSSLKFTDSSNQDYLDWKVDLLSPFMSFKAIKGKNGLPIHHSSASYELFLLGAEGRDPTQLLDNFSPIGMAVWLMDDGHYDQSHKRYTLSIGRYRNNADKQSEITDKFLSLGFVGTFSSSGKNFNFNVDSSLKLASLIAPYVPECMSYKLPKDTIYGGDTLSLGVAKQEIKPTLVPILSITPASPRKYRDRGMYDLSVEDCATYMCGNLDNGFVVHNTFPGGNSLRFASAMTLRLYGKDEIVKEVNAQIPTFKHVTGSIKKAKVPVTSKSFEYDLTLIPHDNMTVGKCPSWNYVATYCKNAGWMTQAGAGKPWVLMGREGKTQKDLRFEYETDFAFQTEIHNAIFGREMSTNVLKGVEEKIDPETGEILAA